MTIFEFCENNRVEVVYNKQGQHECYINFKEGDKPWGIGVNALDAIDRGVNAYVHKNNIINQNLTPEEQQKAVTKFLSTEGLFAWYYFSKKYNKQTLINHYEHVASTINPLYLASLKFLYDKTVETLHNPKSVIKDDYESLNNVFIQSLVYYESLKNEKYENNNIISLKHKTLDVKDIEAFHKIQNTLAQIDIEVQKHENGEL